MKVFIGLTTSEFEEYKEYYLSIRKHVIDLGHVITHDWLPTAAEQIKKPGWRDMNKIYWEVVNGINEADVVIIEDTVSGFSTGFETTIAIQRQKPILVMRTKKNNKYFPETFLDGIKSDYLEISHYTLEDCRTVISSFLNKYENATDRHRFNLVIDEVERKYLEWAKVKYELSRTQLIRRGLRKQIDNDTLYQEFLAQK